MALRKRLHKKSGGVALVVNSLVSDTPTTGPTESERLGFPNWRLAPFDGASTDPAAMMVIGSSELAAG